MCLRFISVTREEVFLGKVKGSILRRLAGIFPGGPALLH